MDVRIKTIPHKNQRYETVGDWVFVPGTNGLDLEVYVSDMGRLNFEMMVGLHEVVEALLCLNRGITEESVSAFDKEFESKRPAGNEDEPGDDPKAPYRKEHFFATSIERLMAAELDIDWKEYDNAVQAL